MPSPKFDPLEILASLTAEDLRARLDTLEAERKAVALLYRSARARERAARDRTDREKAQRSEAK
jgi:hypothetical protein